jgi:hypothetical protein
MQSPARSPRRRQRLRSCAASTPSLFAADAIVSSVARGSVSATFGGGTGGAREMGRTGGALLVVAGMPVWIARTQSRFDADLCPTFVRDPSWTVVPRRPAAKRIRAAVECIELDLKPGR